MRFKDYYDILGVTPKASADEIKSAYRRLARKYHPDVSKEAKAEERFKDINEAYEALKDDQRRAAYDQLRAGGFRAGDEFRPPPNWGQGGGFEFDFGDGQGAQFSDFFESLFGRARGGGARGPGRRGGRHAPHEAQAEIELDLETAFHGGKQRIALNHAGSTRTLEVKIPAGVSDGQVIRLSGQGQPGLDGEPGDLLLKLKLRPHPMYELQGKDVVVRVPITPWEAALGARIPVPTLGGEVEVAIPPGSQSGRKLRLRGRGMPGTTPGDQMVVLEIHTPPAPSEDARAAYEELARRLPFNPRIR